MIVVHIWEAAYLKNRSPGHASIQIGNEYVSFWPGAELSLLKWKGYRPEHSLSADLEHYKAHGQNYLGPLPVPNNQYGPGLDEARMLVRWREITTGNPNYSAKFQCAAVVNELLVAGGARGFVPNTLWYWTSWYIGLVSPDDVKDYTRTLNRMIYKRRS